MFAKFEVLSGDYMRSDDSMEEQDSNAIHAVRIRSERSMEQFERGLSVRIPAGPRSYQLEHGYWREYQ